MKLRSIALAIGCATVMLFGGNIPGENLWRLTNSVYLLASEIDASLDVLTGSSIDYLVSQVQILVSNLDLALTSTSSIISDLDVIVSQLESIDDVIIEGTCSCVEVATSSLSILDTILKSDVDSVSSKLDSCCSTLSVLDVIIKSDVDSVSTKVDSVSTKVNTVTSTVNATATIVNTLQTCLVGTAITQSMIPYTISSPGNYYLCQSVITFSASPAITVSASNVYLDLNGHTITAATGRGINVVGPSNVCICNGAIYPNLEGIFVSLSTDIRLSDITVMFGPSCSICIDQTTAFTIENCIIDNVAGASVTNTGALSIVESGPGYIANVMVLDQTINGGFFISKTPNRNLEFVNCMVDNADYGFSVNQIDGFSTYNQANIIFRDCTATTISGIGFSVTGTAGYQGPMFENCISRANTSHGFFVQNLTSTIFRNCTATSCLPVIGTADGFRFEGTSKIVCEDCISNDNTVGAGFNLVTTANTDANLVGCYSSGNVRGFDIAASTSGTKLDQCMASGNTSNGIRNAGSSTFIIDCRSQNGITLTNPAYNLNGATDSVGTATVIITS